MLDRFSYPILDFFGYWFCEVAFRCWKLFPERRMLGLRWSYRVGCWFGGKATEAAIRCGALVPNPKFGSVEFEPMYVWASKP